jgi:hypothetical protein
MTTRRLLYLLPLLELFAACDNTETQIVEIQIPPPPPPVSLPLVINVQASQLGGDFLLAGGAFPNSLYQSGEIYLRDQATESLVELGKTYDDAYQAMIVNGTYDSAYHHVNGGDVPANVLGVVANTIPVNAPATLDVDVPSASVRASFLLNGAAFPASAYNHATFYLQPVGSDELIVLGDSNIVNDIVNVVPGDYHVIYSHQQGDQVPANKNARLMSNIAISGNAALDIDVISVPARTAFTIDGAPFPKSQYEHAEFYFVDANGDEAFLGKSFDEPGSVSVITGTYDIEYRHQQGDTIPLNKATIVSAGVDLNAGGTAIVDVTSNRLNINATLNGQAFPVSEYQDGILELRDPATGSYSLLGNTHSPFADLAVIPGSYDIVYSHETGDAVPQNVRGTVSSGYVIAGDQQLNLDITGYLLTGSITLDTAAFPQSQYNTADFLVQGPATTEPIFLFASHSQDEPAMVLPGTYDLYYACHNCIDIPFNSFAKIIADLAVDMDGDVVASLTSVRVEASATLNGNAFPASIYQSGFIWGGIGDEDLVELTATQVSTPDIVLLAGDYNFYYQHNNGDQVPLNLWALVDQQTMVAPPN